MNKFNLITGAVITLIALSFFTGCAEDPAPTKAPEEVVKEGLIKSVEVKSYKYSVVVKGDLKDEKGEAMKIDLNMTGLVDGHDDKDPKFTVNFGGSLSDTKEQDISGAGDLRLNGQALFFKLDSLDFDGAEDMPEEFAEMVGKWWKYPLPPEILDELAESLPSGEEGKLTPEQEELKKTLEDAEFFVKPEYVGTEGIKGESSYHYKVTVDKDALIDFAKTSAEARGETVSSEELAEAKEVLSKVDISGGIWIGVNSGVVTQVEVDVDMKGGEDMPTGKIAIKITTWDIGKKFSVDVPADAEEFPLDELLGPMMMPPMDESFLMNEPALEGMTEEEIKMMIESMPADFDLEELNVN